MLLTLPSLKLALLCSAASTLAKQLQAPLPLIADTSPSWKWISVKDTKCADGSETGFALNLAADKSDKRLVINFGGGGACYGYWSCHVESAARNMNKPYTGSTFIKQKRPARLSRYFILNRNSQENPFRQSNYAYIPYCTGDLHAGNAQPHYKHSKKLTYHHGYQNGKLILQAIKEATNKTTIDQYWMTGSSAGGFGAIYHYFNALNTFGHDKAISLIADSSESKGSAYIYSGWNTQLVSKEVCKECDYSHFDSFIPAYAKLRPNDRFAALSYQMDPVLPLYMNFTFRALSREIQTYLKDLSKLPNARGFLMPGHNHITLNKRAARAINGLPLDRFLQEMVDGGKWTAGT